jgi:hypothetical protein
MERPGTLGIICLRLTGKLTALLKQKCFDILLYKTLIDKICRQPLQSNHDHLHPHPNNIPTKEDSIPMVLRFKNE